MVPKSIAAMLPEFTRKPDSFLGTRFATSQPLDVFRMSPMLAMHEALTHAAELHRVLLIAERKQLFCTILAAAAFIAVFLLPVLARFYINSPIHVPGYSVCAA